MVPELQGEDRPTADPGGVEAKPGDGSGHASSPVRPGAVPGEKGGKEIGKEGKAGNGGSENGKKPRRLTLPREDFRAIVVELGGNIAKIAKAIGSTHGNIIQRIAGDPELSPIYGNHRDRRKNQIAHQITTRDLELYRGGLKLYGLSEKHLAKLKSLDKLCTDGSLLIISHKVCLQSYIGLLHHADEIADAVRERMKGTVVPDDDSLIPLNTEDFAELAKIHIECVKERGKGFALMMSGLETIARMTRENDKESPSAPKTPGWGPMKKVRPAENGSNSSDD